MSHRQARDLLPGYVLGSLELRELEELEKHLQSCSPCYQIAQEQVEVAAMLASEIAEAEPPAALWSRVQDSVAEESKPIESRMIHAAPSILDRLGLTGRLPALAASAAVLAVVGLMVAVLVYVLISQGDLNDLQDENATLSAKLSDQLARVTASQVVLDQQSAALAGSQAGLEQLQQANLGLSTKLDEQAIAIAVAQGSLDNVQTVSDSLPPALGNQSEALVSVRGTLAELQQANQALADRVEEQRTALATAQLGLNQLGQDNENLVARIADQDVVLAASQSDIDGLRMENAAVAATVTNQQIFSYLQALPVTNKFVLKATDDAPGTFGLMVTNVGNNWGIIAVLGMEPLEMENWYQLWLERDGVARHGWFIKEIDPVTKFGQVYAQDFPTPVTEFDRIFITLEPNGGSPAPTGPALLQAVLN